MAFLPLEYTKSWNSQADFPTYESDERQVRADLQLLYDEAKEGLNRLVAALNAPTAAGQLPFLPESGLQAQTVQDAIVEVYAAVQEAAAGLLVDGTVSREKLTKALLDRIYGGRVWVSMDVPGAEANPEADLPVGQLWLRPSFILENLALADWSLTACTAQAVENGWRLVADGTMESIRAVQKLKGIGTAGQRVLVGLWVSELDDHLSDVQLFLNGSGHDLSGGGGFFETAVDANGDLELLVRGVWPYEEAGAGLRLEKLTVVNVDAVEASLPGCRAAADWQALLAEQLPFSSVRVPRLVFVQEHAGQWKPVDQEVLPVSRGGTGLAAVGKGQLPVGAGEETLQLLNPGEAQSFLGIVNGVPQWRNAVETVTDLGTLRVMTGTYTGNHTNRTITLPVKPVLLYLFGGVPVWDSYTGCTIDNPVVLANGATVGENRNPDASTELCGYVPYVSLQGKELKFYHYSHINRGQPDLMNTSGRTYTWVALYGGDGT